MSVCKIWKHCNSSGVAKKRIGPMVSSLSNFRNCFFFWSGSSCTPHPIFEICLNHTTRSVYFLHKYFPQSISWQQIVEPLCLWRQKFENDCEPHFNNSSSIAGLGPPLNFCLAAHATVQQLVSKLIESGTAFSWHWPQRHSTWYFHCVTFQSDSEKLKC